MAKRQDPLLAALAALPRSTEFCVAGVVDAVLPGLEAKGVGTVGLPVSPAKARKLIAVAEQAPYGRGAETIVDTRVRRVWQLAPERFTLGNAGWDGLVDRIVGRVREELGIEGKVSASLYKLLIYEKGSFFSPHRDTEKVDGMFASLVVGLPSEHAGGTLIVRHDGRERRIDFADDAARYAISFAAFYADCQHEITPLDRGYRVCLVYNLTLARSRSRPAAPTATRAIAAVAQELERTFDRGKRRKIAVPLEHEYTRAGLDRARLKGADRAVGDALFTAAEKRGYHAYLGLLELHQVGEADYEQTTFGQWDEPDDEDVQMGEIYQEELTIDRWIDTKGRRVTLGAMELDRDEVLWKSQVEELPFQQEVQEATGNEGVTLDRWYRRAVVVLWPASQHFRILTDQGPSVAMPVLQELLAGGDRQAAGALARELVAGWRSSRSGKATGKAAEMLEALAKLGDRAMARRFLERVLPRDASGQEGPALVRLAEALGWKALEGSLERGFAGMVPGTTPARLGKVLGLFESLCCTEPAMTGDRITACRRVAGRIEELIRAWDAYRKPIGALVLVDVRARAGVVDRAVRALAAIGEKDRLDRLIVHWLASRERYRLRKTLVPAVKALYERPGADGLLDASRRALLGTVRARLETRVAVPLPEPVDWAQAADLACRCKDCKQMVGFMRDPEAQVLRLRAAKERRRHLHEQIDGHRLDLSHVTERSGSPYTLVLTKTRASLERRRKHQALDRAALQSLSRLG